MQVIQQIGTPENEDALRPARQTTYIGQIRRFSVLRIMLLGLLATSGILGIIGLVLGTVLGIVLPLSIREKSSAILTTTTLTTLTTTCPAFKEVPGLSLNAGAQIDNGPGPLSDCEGFCTADPACFFIRYDIANDYCYYFGTGGAVIQCPTSPNTIAVKIQNCQPIIPIPQGTDVQCSN